MWLHSCYTHTGNEKHSEVHTKMSRSCFLDGLINASKK